MVGSVTLVLREATLKKLLLPLVALAAGNFIYIAAADLIPAITREDMLKLNVPHFVSFLMGLMGLGLLLVTGLAFE